MSDGPGAIMVERAQPSLLDRATTVSAWALAGALFLTVGWVAMEPDDPLGAVSMLGRSGGGGLLMLIQAGALAAVASGLATLIAGRRLTDVGTFATSIGLAAVSLRGGTAGALLMQNADVSSSFEHGLALKFAVESLCWFVVVLVAVGVSALVMRWCFGTPRDAPAADVGYLSAAAPTVAGYDVPRFSAGWLGVPCGRQTGAAGGIRFTLVAAGLGVAAMALLSAGLSSRSIQHGQECFVVAAAVFIACYVTQRLLAVRSALWAVLAVGLMALAGYAWSAIRPTVAGLPPSIPSSHFMRVLPIQFLSVGTAAAVATFWYVYVPTDDERGSPHGPKRPKKVPKGH